MWRCAGAVALLCAVWGAGDAQRDVKRAQTQLQVAPVPFVLGSRYGRSLPSRVMAPRNDRFFMGSRYGKRSMSESLPPLPSASTVALACHYTGVPDLYRCTRPSLRHTPYDRKSDDDAYNKDDE